ncbi:MAG: hypothetical protein ABFE07_29350 [Armatimonadia bacterium]
MADANKTELTLRVTEAAANWLSGIGAKAVETEVGVDAGWIADLAAFWAPTRTEAQRSHLLSKCPDRNCVYDADKDCYVWSQEGEDRVKAWEENYERTCLRQLVIVHEVKTSRGDFKGDDKWTRKPVADLQVLSYVRGIVKPEELPVGWWHLEHAESGKLIKASKCPPVHDVGWQQRFDVVSQICERRCNREKYKFFKELQQSHRDNENERINRQRLTDCMGVCLGILDGQSVEEATSKHLWGREKLPGYVLERLEELVKRRLDLEQQHRGDQEPGATQNRTQPGAREPGAAGVV